MNITSKDELKDYIYNCVNASQFSEAYIKKYFPEIYNSIILFTDYPEEFKFSQKIYHYLRNDHNLKLGVCPMCGKRCKFKSLFNGYNAHCSQRCSTLDKNTQTKIKQTCLSKYNCEHASKNKDVLNKMKQTCLEKYGSNYFMGTNEFKEKSKQTKIEKYNDEKYNNIEKARQTCLEKYGKENYTQTDEFLEKSKQTKLEKYCDENYSNRDKAKETCLKRFGYENQFQSECVKEKTRQTCLEKYGTEYFMCTDEFKEKSKETCIEKFGADNYAKSCEFKNKFKDAEFIQQLKDKNLQKFGSDWYFQSEEFKRKFDNYEWVKSIQDKIYNTKKKNNTFNTSKIEEQLQLYLDSLGVNYIHQYTSDQYPFNCDFYFPDKDLYIEIQGTWTHGPGPFTGSEEDLKLLEKWKSKNTKYYQSAIETWTIRDVRKRETAKQNKLNYLEIFSYDFETVINELGKYIK